jgi:hypothetical protein
MEGAFKELNRKGSLRVFFYEYERDGWSMLTLLPSVSKKDTYNPTPGISIGSPSTLPPAFSTLFICSLISSTAITTEGYCAGLSAYAENQGLWPWVIA